MAKVTELPPALALNGTEGFPLVQDGALRLVNAYEFYEWVQSNPPAPPVPPTEALFASLRMPPENGELVSAANGNGGLYLPTTANLLRKSSAGDTPLFAAPGAIAVRFRLPIDIYAGIRRGITLVGNFNLLSSVANRRISIGIVSGADNANAANTWRPRVRLIGETSGGAVDLYGPTLPIGQSDSFVLRVLYDNTNLVVEVDDCLTGTRYAGAPVAKPVAWAGIPTLTGALGIGVSAWTSTVVLPAAFPQDRTNVFGRQNIGYFRGELGGVLFLETNGTNAQWEDFALGADPASIWTDTIRAWYPLTNGTGLDLAPVKNLPTNVTVGDLEQLGTVLPGSTIRRQSEAKFLLVKNLPDPALCPVRRATLDPANPGAARGWFACDLTMGGQTAGENIEMQIFKPDGTVVRNWQTVGTSVANGDVTVRIDLPPGIYRGRVRIGADQSEINSDIVISPAILFNAQSQARYTFGLYLTELGDNTALNTPWAPGVGERTFIAARGNTATVGGPSIFRAANAPGIIGDGFITAANTIAASPDYPSSWPIILIETAVNGTTIEDTLENGGSPDDRDMSNIYEIATLLAGRNPAGKVDLTSWYQFWHSSGSVVDYAQTFMPPMLNGTPTGTIVPDDWFRSGLVIDPGFSFIHGEPNRNIATALGASSNTDSRTEHLTRKNLREQEPNYDYTLGAPCDVHRLDGNVFTHPDRNQQYGSPFVARIAAKSVLYEWGFAGGWAGPVSVASAKFTDASRTVIDVTFTGPADLALGVLNGGAISGFEVDNTRAGFTAAIVGANVVRLTCTSGAWSAGAFVELKPGGPGDYGAGFDEAAFINGALINAQDGMLVRGTIANVAVAEA